MSSAEELRIQILQTETTELHSPFRGKALYLQGLKKGALRLSGGFAQSTWSQGVSLSGR